MHGEPLMMPSTEQIAAVKRFIAQTWDSTVRQPAEQGAGEVPLPYPFIVPTAGPEFHIFFYWDTYFACEGLLRDGRVELARHNADNMLHLIETLGYVPNFTITEHLNRSQPPLASALVRAVYERTGDRDWLGRAHATLHKEYAFWMTLRQLPVGLNHHGHHGDPKAVDNFYWVVRERLLSIPDEPAARMRYLHHAMAEAETGWDFNPRFDRRCADFAAIDLNSLLYLHESNAAFFADELGSGDGNLWRERAARRRSLLDRLCWDDARGLYFDYDAATERRSPVVSVATLYPLWAGLASPEQAARVVASLPLIEVPFGIVACAPGELERPQPYQWDHPNAWPPTQFAAMAGLLRYGYQAEARRVAEKYLACVCGGFAQTGNLWEKYNGVTGGVDVTDEYAMPAMLGWTAGTFLFACDVVQP